MPVVQIRNNNNYGDMLPIPRDLNLHPVDDMVRRMNRLCWIVNHPEVTGKLIQLGIQIGGTGVGQLRDNLYLNQVPHNRYVRNYFYDMAADAVLQAVILCSQQRISNRMKVISMFPEMNPSMDSYRYVSLSLSRSLSVSLSVALLVCVCISVCVCVSCDGAWTPQSTFHGPYRLVQP